MSGLACVGLENMDPTYQAQLKGFRLSCCCFWADFAFTFLTLLINWVSSFHDVGIRKRFLIEKTTNYQLNPHKLKGQN